MRKNMLVGAGAILALALIGSLMPGYQVLAQNPTAGTPNPNPGSAPVNIVSPLPLPVTGSVAIENTATTPFFVTNIDEPGRNPYQERHDFAFGAGGCATALCTVTFSPVPAGRRLVITNVSGRLRLEGGAIVNFIVLSEGGASGQPMQVYIPTQSEGLAGATQFRQFNEQIHLYVEASNAPTISFALTAGTTVSPQSVSVSGYYVSVP